MNDAIRNLLAHVLDLPVSDAAKVFFVKILIANDFSFWTVSAKWMARHDEEIGELEKAGVLLVEPDSRGVWVAPIPLDVILAGKKNPRELPLENEASLPAM